MVEAFTKLLVADVEAARRFFEALGFTRVGTDGTFVHLRWQRAGDVMLVGAPKGAPVDVARGSGVLLCFTSETSLGELTERATKVGAHVSGPTRQPWNTVELIVVTPDGYRLNFLAPGSSDAAPR
jgi:predicted lactoylglutathione lyase